MRWVEGLKIWNEKKGGAWCVPRKGTPEHAEVKAIMAGDKKVEKVKVKPRISEKGKAMIEERKVESKKEKVKSFLKRAVEKYKAKKATKEEDLEQLAKELEKFTEEARKPAKEKTPKNVMILPQKKIAISQEDKEFLGLTLDEELEELEKQIQEEEIAKKKGVKLFPYEENDYVNAPERINKSKLFEYIVGRTYDVRRVPVFELISESPPVFRTVYYRVRNSKYPYQVPVKRANLLREFTFNKSTGSYDAITSRGATKGKIADRIIPYKPEGIEKEWLEGTKYKPFKS
jgi:hypothetical protein